MLYRRHAFGTREISVLDGVNVLLFQLLISSCLCPADFAETSRAYAPLNKMNDSCSFSVLQTDAVEGEDPTPRVRPIDCPPSSPFNSVGVDEVVFPGDDRDFANQSQHQSGIPPFWNPLG